jgi:hypothetical protein
MYNGFKLSDTEVTLKVNSHIEDRAHAVPRRFSDRASNIMCRSHSALFYFHLKYTMKMCGKFVILTFHPMVHSYGEGEDY